LRGIVGEILKKVSGGVLEAVLGVFLRDVPGRVWGGTLGEVFDGSQKRS